MSALPFDARCFYTVDEFAGLPEDNSMRYELVDGRIVASPQPALPHMLVVHELYAQLRPQLPDELLVVGGIDVDLQLTPPVVRIPDLVIVRARAAYRTGLVKARDVLLVVEVVSPGSVRTDTKIKPVEYAEAGIPHLWLVDPQPPVTATVHRLVTGSYHELQRAERTLLANEPRALRVELDSLLPRRARLKPL